MALRPPTVLEGTSCRLAWSGVGSTREGGSVQHVLLEEGKQKSISAVPLSDSPADGLGKGKAQVDQVFQRHYLPFPRCVAVEDITSLTGNQNRVGVVFSAFLKHDSLSYSLLVPNQTLS